MASTQFLHVALNCKDPIAIERFYTKYFGFKRARVYDPGPKQVVVIQAGSLALELFLAVGHGRVKGPDQIDVKICSKTSYLSLAFVL